MAAEDSIKIYIHAPLEEAKGAGKSKKAGIAWERAGIRSFLS